MDGYAVARAFRAHPVLHDTFMVALSGYARPDDLRRAREAGFDQHLAKPTSPETLDRLICEARREQPPSGLQYAARASTDSLSAP